VNTDTDLFGPYRLDGVLGRGGMGEVYRAYDTEHQRTVAIKRLVTSLVDDPEFQERFRREAYNVARLRSPHVIPIHRYGEIDGQLYLDMRLVDGGDLDQLIASTGPLPPARAVAILAQLASALDDAHANGLVHRDVKPSNVLLDGQVADFCYLTDFGITRMATSQPSTSLTRTGALMGTLAYMAPEQFEGAVTQQSDIYSLTCVFFELLTARRPYEGDGMVALMHAHLHRDPPSPSDHVPAAVRFDAVVARGMAKDPAARFPSAGALATAARLALEGAPETVAAVPPTAFDDEPTVRTAFTGGPPPTTGAHAPTPPFAPPSALPPTPSGPPPRRGRHWLPVLAVALIAAVVAGAVLLTRGVGATITGSAGPATSQGPAAPPTAPAAVGPVLAEAVFTGRTADNGLTLAVGIKDGKAAGYLCDGKSMEAWLEGDVAGSTVTLHGRDPSTVVTAKADQHALLGSVAVGGMVRSFAADVAAGRAGLYQNVRVVNGITTRIGWIVLPDGSQVGIANRNGKRAPAPPLDLATLQAVDGGQPVSAQPVSGTTDVLPG
jgi:Protein kinase domain